MERIKAGDKNTRLHSSVTFARNASQEHIIFDLIFGHIQTSDPSFAPSAVKPSHASTIASATKVSIRARRNSSAVVRYRAPQVGVVGVDLLVQML